ncbi:MAG: RIP metalloprotease RseP [Candidatus Delongbacteria bacterium]|nr:RIP metalloprotease RseP [Candidatus Delongbacteria bacterium]
MLTLISFIILLGIIVFVHESGHYLAAKLFGIKVEVFSLGFGKAIVKKKIGDTEYRIAWIPLGGYVKITGMIDESFDEEKEYSEPKANEFESKNFFQKAFVISAGVIMNMLLAIFIYTIITFFNGIAEPNSTFIQGFTDNSPAKEAGILPDDKIIAIDNIDITDWDHLSKIIHAKPDTDLEFKILRADSVVNLTIKTLSIETFEDSELKKIGVVGIYPDFTIRDAGIIKSVSLGFKTTWYWLEIGVYSIKMLVTGQASMKDLGGPVMIAQMTGESAKAGFWAFLNFLAFISINIGFLNILPIPILDGGHLLFLSVEAVLRRKIPTNIKFRILQAGMILLLLFTMIVLYNDIGRVVNGDDVLNPPDTETAIEKNIEE